MKMKKGMAGKKTEYLDPKMKEGKMGMAKAKTGKSGKMKGKRGCSCGG